MRLEMTDGALSCDAQCLSMVKNGAPRETPILRGRVVHGECRGEKVRAEGQGSAKTGVTTPTYPSQVTTSKTWNENSPVDVHHQRPKDEIWEWPSQDSPSLSIHHAASEKEQTQTRGVLQRASVEKLLLQGLK